MVNVGFTSAFCSFRHYFLERTLLIKPDNGILTVFWKTAEQKIASGHLVIVPCHDAVNKVTTTTDDRQSSMIAFCQQDVTHPSYPQSLFTVVK